MMTKSASSAASDGGAVHRHQSPQKMPSSQSAPSKKRAAPAPPPSSSTVAIEAPPPAKFRKRQISCYAHLNVRDPLNLGSVRPDNPDDPNFAKPIQLIPTNVNDPLNLQTLSADDADTDALTANAPGQQKRKSRKRARAAAAQPRDESDEPTTSDDLSPPPRSASTTIAAAVAGTVAKRRFTWKGEMTTASTTTITPTTLMTAATPVADDEPATAATVAETTTEATLVVVKKNEEEEVEGEEAPQPSTSKEPPVAAGEAVADADKGGGAATEEEAEAASSARWERRRKMAERYRYGNFNHYQMRREFRLATAGAVFFDPQLQQQQLQQQQQTLLQAVEDPRVRFFCPDWFQDKTVLDIGSNAGHFAISLARAFQPRRVVGVDIDSHLVGAARKNIRHFCDKDTKMSGKFPASFAANFGPISAPSTSDGPHFPDNVWFFCQNYVPSSDAALEKVNEEFDIIFALACSKWVHLNWGDAGIKRFFLRAFRQLRTGGRFVLETAPFKDYRKHCKRAAADRPPEEVLRNFGAIRFHPEEFTGFLLGTVGFSHHEELDSAHSKALGISGRLQVFYKGQFMLMDNADGDDDDDDDGEQYSNNNDGDAQQQQQQQQQKAHEQEATTVKSE